MTAKQWAGRLLLHAPAPLRSLRNAPLIGGLIHRFSHKMLPADEKVWVQVEEGPAKGIWLRLNPRTGQHYLRGEGEQATQQVLLERLKPGMVFYDLGANIGFFSMLAARLVGAGGKVVSFEPDPEVAARLRENAERNAFANVSVCEAGVWSTSGMMEFAAAADAASPDHGTGRFVSDGKGKPTRCVALDDFARTAPAPDAIKCDVEGAETEALRGAFETLKRSKPWVLCETHSPEADRESREILARAGYAIESIDALHFLALPDAQAARARKSD
jgi:FkbM family methyltransferase